MNIGPVKLLVSFFITILLSFAFIFTISSTSSSVVEAGCDSIQVQVSPSEPTKNESITVRFGATLDGEYSMYIVDDDGDELWNKNLGELDIDVYTEDIDLGTISGLEIGKHYNAQVRSSTGMGSGCGQAGFTVRDSTTPPSNEHFEAPSGDFPMGTTILPSIRVADVNPGTTYRLRLHGRGHWSGYIEDENDHVMDFTPSGNVIGVNNICENGNSNRTNCTDEFDPGTYDVELVIASNNDVKARTTFTVAGGGGEPGKNPCTEEGCDIALGNISISVGGFAQRVLNIAIGLAGGIALILMVIGSIRVLTSSGDQQRLAGGRDMIVAAIAGLLFLIFSVLVLRFIGAEILDIPFFR